MSVPRRWTSQKLSVSKWNSFEMPMASNQQLFVVGHLVWHDHVQDLQSKSIAMQLNPVFFCAAFVWWHLFKSINRVQIANISDISKALAINRHTWTFARIETNFSWVFNEPLLFRLICSLFEWPQNAFVLPVHCCKTNAFGLEASCFVASEHLMAFI